MNELLIPTSLIEPSPQSKLLIVHIPLPGVGEGVTLMVGVFEGVIFGVGEFEGVTFGVGEFEGV
jgi:hypothetical protein